MPQIWMTYDEIASLIGCNVEQARPLILARHLDRKKSRDGRTRVKLDVLWTALLIEKIRQADFDLSRAIAGLRNVHRELTDERRVTRSA